MVEVGVLIRGDLLVLRLATGTQSAGTTIHAIVLHMIETRSEMRLLDPSGNRLYLDAEERQAFLLVAREQERERRTFCETLYFTGCRISEALEITPKRVEIPARQIILRSLKKRREDVFRSVPVPADFLDTLNMVHEIKKARRRPKEKDAPLWDWTRVHAWRMIKEVMELADIAAGPHRTPKGLRHSYGVNGIVSGIPLNMLSKWMGHSDIKTTAIYANAIGKEEQDIAARMW